jgi:hypothetical protein
MDQVKVKLSEASFRVFYQLRLKEFPPELM